MRILIITAYRVNGVPGGLATVVRNLYKFFQKFGHETDMVSFDTLPKAFKVMAYLPFDFLNNYFFKLGELWAIIVKNLIYFPLVLVKCLSKPYDVINVHDSESALSMRVISRLFNIPMVLTVHGPSIPVNDPEWPESFISKRMYMKISELAWRYANVIAVLSRSEMESLLKFDASLNKKLVIVPNGIDLEIIQQYPPVFLEGDPSVLYVGGLGWRKGVDLLIKAFKMVNEALPASFLHLLGEGSNRRELERLVTSTHTHNVIFHGTIFPAYAHIRGADIIVVPSRVESFGLVALEAMAAQKPLIVSKVGGLRELVKDFENGLLVSTEPEDIAEKIRMLWQNPELMERLSRNASKTAQEYSWERVVKRYLQVFEHASRGKEIRGD